MSQYTDDIDEVARLVEANGSTWKVEPENVARMRAQNRFRTGLDVARHTARIMREDMAAYDADNSKYLRFAEFLAEPI